MRQLAQDHRVGRQLCWDLGPGLSVLTPRVPILLQQQIRPLALVWYMSDLHPLSHLISSSNLGIYQANSILYRTKLRHEEFQRPIFDPDQAPSFVVMLISSSCESYLNFLSLSFLSHKIGIFPVLTKTVCVFFSIDLIEIILAKGKF